MKRLILVEGLPGTGKTTVTRRLADCLAAHGGEVTALFEGDERIPTDFYELAGVPADVFDALRGEHPELPDAQWGIALRTGRYAFVRLNRCAGLVADAFRRWDMGDDANPQISVAEYTACALERVAHWAGENQRGEGTAVMDSGFMQNPVNELLFRGAGDSQVRAYIQGLARLLAPLDPVCLYLRRESAQAAIAYARRVKGEVWAAGVDELLRDDGFPDFFTCRFALELALLAHIPHVTAFVDGDDWSEADRQIGLLCQP